MMTVRNTLRHQEVVGGEEVEGGMVEGWWVEECQRHRSFDKKWSQQIGHSSLYRHSFWFAVLQCKCHSLGYRFASTHPDLSWGLNHELGSCSVWY